MIIACKILRYALPSHPLIRYLKSIQTNGQQTSQADKLIQLRPEAQRALWAYHFIKTIITQHFTSIEQPSLRDKLIDSSNPTLQHKFDQDIKEEMTSIFTKGVKLNQIFPDQDRILKATFKNERVSFYPSWIVTKKVFRIMQNSRSRQLFQGSYGIGKTISIAFYIYLSNFINKYTLLATRDKKSKQFNFYKTFVKNEFLPFDPKKFWYWSIDWELADSQQFNFQRMLAEQASELTDEEREEIRLCKNIKEAHVKIRQFYKNADFDHATVLDQIHLAVSLVENWNSFVRNNQDLINKANSKEQIEIAERTRMNLDYLPATKIRSLLGQFTAINPVHYILSTPVRIKTYLLETKEIIYDKKYRIKQYQELTLQLKSKNKYHQPLIAFQIRFSQQLEFQYGKLSFWKFFVNLLEQRIKSHLTKQELIEFKLAFLKYAFTVDLKLCYRFFHIRLFLNDYKFPQFEHYREEIKNEIVRKIIFEFDKSSFYRFQDNLVNFTKRGNTAFKKSLLLAIYMIAKQQKQKRKRLFVDFYQVGRMMKIPGLEYTFRQHLQLNEPNQQTIPFDDVPYELYKINISWTAQEYMLIANKVLFGWIFKGNMLLPDHKQYIMKINNIYCGIKIKDLLNQLLAAGTKLKFKTVTNVRELKQDQKYSRSRINLKEDVQSFKIFDTQNFKAFDTAYNAKSNDNEKVKNIEQHFENVFFKCVKNPERWIALIPVRKHKKSQQEELQVKEQNEQQERKKEKEDEQTSQNEQEEKDVPNNPSIDFALVRSILKETTQGQYAFEFEIYTYDITIDRRVSKKERDAKIFLEVTTKDLKKTIRVHHHILCLKQNGLPVLPVNKVADISYSSIEDLKIQVNKENAEIRKLLEEVIVFTVQKRRTK